MFFPPMLAELLGHILMGIVRVVGWILDVVRALFFLRRKMDERSLVVESPLEEEHRRWWQRVEQVLFVIVLVLMAIAAGLGVAVNSDEAPDV